MSGSIGVSFEIGKAGLGALAFGVSPFLLLAPLDTGSHNVVDAKSLAFSIQPADPQIRSVKGKAECCTQRLELLPPTSRKPETK